MPGPEPSSIGLVLDAAVEIARRPVALVDTVRGAARDLGETAGRVASLAGEVVSAGHALLRRPVASPLTVELGEQRRLAVARTRLDDYRQVRDAFGGTVNDVMLAVVAGALRGWLMSRAQPIRPATAVRALVPVSVNVGDLDAATGRGSGTAREARPVTTRVRPLLVDLPVGEPDPVLRLAQLRYAMASHRASGRAVGAETLVQLSGYAPPTLHALGARAAAGLTRRMFSLTVTNVPGPQWPLYAAGARMSEMYPIVPLSPGHAVSIAMSSYDGGVYWGINGDRDAMPDVALLAGLIEESLAELTAASEGERGARAGGAREQMRRDARPQARPRGGPGRRGGTP